MYKRKTRDIYQILCDYGSGIEVVTEEDNFKDCKRMLNDYKSNDVYATRITWKKIRERIVGTMRQYRAFYDTGYGYGSFIFNSSKRANSKQNQLDAENRFKEIYGHKKANIYKIQRCNDNE